MSYQVHIIRSAEKERDRLPSTVQTRLSQRILSPEENPRPRGVKKLSGREEYRLRVGDYRILYVMMTEIRLSPSWPWATGVKYMVKSPLLSHNPKGSQQVVGRPATYIAAV